MDISGAKNLCVNEVEAAYAVVFCLKNGEYLPVLTEREDGKGYEFQGGRPEAQDSTTYQTALREGMEEFQLTGEAESLFFLVAHQRVSAPERIDASGRIRPPACYDLFCFIASDEAVRQMNNFTFKEGESEVRSILVVEGSWPEKMTITQKNFFLPVVEKWRELLNSEETLCD